MLVGWPRTRRGRGGVLLASRGRGRGQPALFGVGKPIGMAVGVAVGLGGSAPPCAGLFVGAACLRSGQGAGVLRSGKAVGVRLGQRLGHAVAVGAYAVTALRLNRPWPHNVKRGLRGRGLHRLCSRGLLASGLRGRGSFGGSHFVNLCFARCGTIAALPMVTM